MATKKEAETVKTEAKKEVKKETSSSALVAAEKKSRHSAAQIYKAQKKVNINISPLYRPYFGDVMEIIINGVYCAIPVDGRTYKLPQSFANEAARRINAVDAQNTRAEKLADVQNNHENFIGELRLV